MYVTLEQVKHHLNIEDDFHGDDNYIEYLIDVAEDAIQTHARISFPDIIANREDGTLPPVIVHAIMLTIAHYYQDREATTDKKPYFDCVDRLIDTFRDYSK